MKTLLLDQSAWDLVIDSNGNIAVASDPYSQAQDAASEIKTFEGEVYYNTNIGLPYFQEILAKSPPLQLLKEDFVQAALLVPGVTSAKCFIATVSQRALTGQVQISNSSGQTSASMFSSSLSPTPPLPPEKVLTSNDDVFILTTNSGVELTP